MNEFLGVLLVAGVWTLLGFGIARENERVVKIRLGRVYGMADSGIFWIPFLIAWVRRYPKKVVELQIVRRNADGEIARDSEGRARSAGGFITKRDTGAGGVGPINMGVSLSLRFRWPESFAYLKRCVELLPPPDDEKALADIFQEPVMDEVRSVGCTMTYLEIMMDRVGFARQVRDAMSVGEASRLFAETGLEPTTQVVVDHIELPQEALEAIDDEEAARMRAEATKRTAEGEKVANITRAEGEKDAIRLRGEGQAAAIRAIKGEGPEAMDLEGMRTLREMAAGQANTIFVPIDSLRKVIGSLVGKKGD